MPLNSIVFSFLLILFACLQSSCLLKTESLFSRIPIQKSHLNFQNTLTESTNINILDYLYFYNGAGLAIGDINNDGLSDVFFTSNQGKNKLFINKGNLKFEDISEKAGISGNSDWNTGAIMFDANGDGLLDIYVCAVVGLQGFSGHNELFINNGDTTFTESAKAYQLDFENYSTTAAVLDYDLDGDLDLYLLNHAIHDIHSYGKAKNRLIRHPESGDKLLRNDQGKFTDVSKEAGIFGGKNGYGLGISIADFNMDGYPDIFIGNDFYEDDFLYINSQNGAFIEQSKQYFGQNSRFSMGADAADLNQDGFPDLITLDMLPEDETVLKSSAGDENAQLLAYRNKKLGFQHQYSRNMLFINQEGQNFSEQALLSGVAATDWSWSALFADFNLDTRQDLFISNGILRRPNDLDYIRFISSNDIRFKLSNTKLVDNEALKRMPSGKHKNYFFEGQSDLIFKNQSHTWLRQEAGISNSAALADLDNDGDIDLITNNLNTPASLLANQNPRGHHYLKISLQFPGHNSFAIGSKVISEHQGIQQIKELYPARGFQASSEPALHFGYGKASQIDSLTIIWPDNTYEVLKNVKTNQHLKISPSKNRQKFNYSRFHKKTKPLFKKIPHSLGIDFKHEENTYFDFSRQKLMPYKISDKGPALAIGDLNQDGLPDIYLGSAKNHSESIFFQTQEGFKKQLQTSIQKSSLFESNTALITDLNGDNKQDVVIGNGGGEFFGTSPQLNNHLFYGTQTGFKKVNLPETFDNTRKILSFDFDKDGDLDLFTVSGTITNQFGQASSASLLKNTQGHFSIIQDEVFKDIGMMTDAIHCDFNQDGWEDLMIIGEWMSPQFFKNNQGLFENVSSLLLPEAVSGLWQSIIAFDIDADGDEDYLLGNWGLNSKFKASNEYPMHLYYGDIDLNGDSETLIALAKNKTYYPMHTLDELSAQIPTLMKKKFTTYKAFAGKSFFEIFPLKTLSSLKKLSINTLASGYLENQGQTFIFKAFPNTLQSAPITEFIKDKFQNKAAVFAAGNSFSASPYNGRLGAFSGALIENTNKISLGKDIGINLSHKAVRHLDILNYQNKKYLVVVINDGPLEIYQIL